MNIFLKYLKIMMFGFIFLWIILFLFDKLEALKVMRVDQLNAGRKTLVKNIRFKNTFLNYFTF